MKPSTKRMVAVLTYAFMYVFFLALLDALFGITTPISFWEALLMGFALAWCNEADNPDE